MTDYEAQSARATACADYWGFTFHVDPWNYLVVHDGREAGRGTSRPATEEELTMWNVLLGMTPESDGAR
jgi:hypothetical protein